MLQYYFYTKKNDALVNNVYSKMMLVSKIREDHRFFAP